MPDHNDTRLDATNTALLTYRGVAALLTCSEKSVVRLGEAIPGRVQLGRLVRFDRGKILAWIAAGCPTTHRNIGPSHIAEDQ